MYTFFCVLVYKGHVGKIMICKQDWHLKPKRVIPNRSIRPLIAYQRAINRRIYSTGYCIKKQSLFDWCNYVLSTIQWNRSKKISPHWKYYQCSQQMTYDCPALNSCTELFDWCWANKIDICQIYSKISFTLKPKILILNYSIKSLIAHQRIINTN